MKITLDTKSVIYKSQNTILSAAFILAFFSGINGILGVLRGRLLTTYFGVSPELAVFYTADRIPYLVYSVLIVGAISTVFIPVYTSLLKKDPEEANKTASSIITTTLMFFLVLGTAAFIFAPGIISLLALGKFSTQQLTLGVSLMRIMLVSQLILVAGSLISSVLQSYKFFLMPAIAPVAYNLGMILGIVFLSPRFGIYGPAIGVALGSMLHLAVQIPVLLKTKFTYRLSLHLKDKNFFKALYLIPPRIVSVLLSNLVETINNSLAILVSTSAVVYLKFSMQLQNFPVNLFGIAIASAALPTLAVESEKDDYSKFKTTFLTSLHQMTFLIMPLGMILFILRVPAVRLVYGVSNFPWDATIYTSQALAYFAVSIFAQSANILISRAYYALKDTLTPVLVSIGTVIINVAISVILITQLKAGVWALAFSYSFTSFIDLIVLTWLLGRKLGGFELSKLFTPFAKIAASTLLMGVTLYLPMKLLDNFVLDTTYTLNLLILTVVAGFAGMITYLLFTHLLKVEEIELLYKLLRKLNIKQKEVKSEVSVIRPEL